MLIETNDTKIQEILKSFQKTRKISQSHFLDKLSEILQRCNSVGIPHIPESVSNQDRKLAVQIPSGREKVDLYVRDLQQAELLLSIPFEKTRGITGYRAFCSYENNSIEAMLETGRRFAMPPAYLFQRMQRSFFRSGDQETEDESNNRLEFAVDESYPNLKISIGQASYAFSILEASRANTRIASPPGRLFRPLTIQIEGMPISKHEQALALLEKVTNACLFQLDLTAGFPMYLAMDSGESRRFFPRRAADSAENHNLTLPKFQYDAKPMSLYWYASTTEGIPLLQFLAYYQVIEFYFPMFAEKATYEIAKRLLKDPTFDRSRDTHINQLISSLKPYLTKGGFGEERTALLTTIRECVTEKELRNFFQDDKERFEFFRSKAQVISSEKISVDSDKSDIVSQTVNRIYDVRCKIVHTKASENINADILLPFSKEAQLLGFDIELVQFIARKVLIVSGTPLSL